MVVMEYLSGFSFLLSLEDGELPSVFFSHVILSSMYDPN